MDKTIRKNPTAEDQQEEVFLYWESLSPGERLSAVCQLSKDAYAFTGMTFDGPRPPRTLVRVQRP